MKKLTLNYEQCLLMLTYIGGQNPVTGRNLTDGSGTKKGLLQEELSQGTKVRLNRIYKKVQELFKDYEAGRIELVNKYKGEKESIDKDSPELEIFMKEFSSIASEIFEIEIDSIDFERIENLTSEIDYTSCLDLICEMA